MEAAGRAGIFRNDMEYFCQASAPEIIRFVNGDMSKVAELITYLLDKAADWLNRYAEKDREWEVVIPPGELESLPDEQEGDAGMEDEDETE
jgi:hypothetical protein